MAPELDIILNQLSDSRSPAHSFNFIADAFGESGTKSLPAFLKYLTDEGYVERLYGKASLYKLTDKGVGVYRQGGFAHAALMRKERKIAQLLTVVTVLLVTIIVTLFSRQIG